jgi:hypothetical protein
MRAESNITHTELPAITCHSKKSGLQVRLGICFLAGYSVVLPEQGHQVDRPSVDCSVLGDALFRQDLTRYFTARLRHSLIEFMLLI